MADGGEASERQGSSLAGVRTRVWELHLRGMARTRIAEQVGLNRQTVGRHIAACLREQMGAEQRQKREQMLEAAVARMRHIQEQAWADHDADDERERAVLGLGDGEREGREEGAKDAKEGRGSQARVMARYPSQRAQYLRVVLEAEREIARLLGLYEASGSEGAAVVFRLERVAQESSAVRTEDTLSDTANSNGD